MENKRKIPKRIFTLFLAILCTFGILFVSYISSYAETFYFESTSFPGSSFVFPSTSFTSDVSSATLVHSSWGTRNFTILSSSSTVYYVGVINDNSRGYSGPLFFSSGDFTINSSSTHASSFLYNDLRVYYYSNNWVMSPTSLTPSPLVHVDCSDYTHNDYFSRYSWLLLNSVVNPTPEPTSTPEPTPTPNPYGPGPVPTIPPGEQSYTDFFSRLASDAQSAFNAIFLSWNNANSRFYSGIFFIGFPILLGIIGLVASIFFGDDD